MARRYYRIKELIELTGLSRSTIYKLMKAGLFPQQTVLGTTHLGWAKDAVHATLDARDAEAQR